MKKKQINIRLTDNEYKIIKSKSKDLGITMTELIVDMVENGEIKIYNDLIQTQTQLRYIGNNLNQLTKLCHEGRIECLDLNEVKEEVKRIWQSLNLLI